MKIDIRILDEQIQLVDILANNASSGREYDLLNGIANLLSEVAFAAEKGEYVHFEEVNGIGSYTAFVYEDDGGYIVDESTYDNKQEAIDFAESRNWDEVINDNTGEVVWHK